MARVGFGDDVGGEGADGRNSDVVGGVGGESCHGSEVVKMFVHSDQLNSDVLDI